MCRVADFGFGHISLSSVLLLCYYVPSSYGTQGRWQLQCQAMAMAMADKGDVNGKHRNGTPASRDLPCFTLGLQICVHCRVNYDLQSPSKLS